MSSSSDDSSDDGPPPTVILDPGSKLIKLGTDNRNTVSDLIDNTTPSGDLKNSCQLIIDGKFNFENFPKLKNGSEKFDHELTEILNNTRKQCYDGLRCGHLDLGISTWASRSGHLDLGVLYWASKSGHLKLCIYIWASRSGHFDLDLPANFSPFRSIIAKLPIRKTQNFNNFPLQLDRFRQKFSFQIFFKNRKIQKCLLSASIFSSISFNWL